MSKHRETRENDKVLLFLHLDLHHATGNRMEPACTHCSAHVSNSPAKPETGLGNLREMSKKSKFSSQRFAPFALFARLHFFVISCETIFYRFVFETRETIFVLHCTRYDKECWWTRSIIDKSWHMVRQISRKIDRVKGNHVRWHLMCVWWMKTD